jgi:hypothetical protein
VSGSTESDDSNDWQPATSEPGELYTVEGRILSVGAFARGATNKDPRLKAYRRSMQRTALVFVAAAVVVGVLVAVVAAVFN